MKIYRFKFYSGPDYSVSKVHDEKLLGAEEAKTFAMGMHIGGAKVKSYDFIRLRLRRFLSGRVVSSQLFDEIDIAEAHGQNWAASRDADRHTYAISEGRAPKA